MASKPHDDHGGLGRDLPRIHRAAGRRDFLRALGGLGLGLAGIAACSPKNVVTAADGATCADIPEETEGPYPGDGSNGPNALAASGIVRSDIRPSLAGGAVAEGVPLTITLTLVGTGSGCALLAGYVVYLWHCDREGRYSMYSQGVTSETYLRGVQEAGANGQVTFTTVFPGAYSGRWPHVHFEIFPSLAAAKSASGKIATSQLALPEDACNAAYATAGYEASVGNMARTSLSSDNIFDDGAPLQMAAVQGSAASGYVATLTVGVAA